MADPSNPSDAAAIELQIAQSADTIRALKQRIARERSADLARLLQEQQVVVAEWRRLVGKFSDDNTPNPEDPHRPINRRIPGEQGIPIAEAKLAAIKQRTADFAQAEKDLVAEESKSQALQEALGKLRSPAAPPAGHDAAEPAPAAA